ncbi:hypothetical protein N7537_006695 [Penicillium hordei]|uniref:Uncharacterized protein n=1 Tax=Penicillium hordei TaxID=40994 RepID=A0AAD6E9B8_9EURO|nr:uncharacterized protein N7537_006695 [Penicillium hordei]KAJ5603739.1 hypothetical protein N7537_006695 [Penicillium hordei]
MEWKILQNSLLAVLTDCSGRCANTTSDRRGIPLNHARNWTQKDDPWQDVELATGIPDDGSQPLNGRRTRWIYSLLWQAGCIQAEKTLESTSQAPLLFCLSLRLTTEIPLPILNVPIFVLARIRPSVCGKSMVVVSAQQAKLPERPQANLECYQPGKLVFQLNGGSRTLHTPAFYRRQIVEGNATFGAGQQRPTAYIFLIPAQSSNGNRQLGCQFLGTLHSRVSSPSAHARTPSIAAPLRITGTSEMSNVTFPCILWWHPLAGGPPAVCDKGRSLYDRLNIACSVYHYLFDRKSHIGPHRWMIGPNRAPRSFHIRQKQRH